MVTGLEGRDRAFESGQSRARTRGHGLRVGQVQGRLQRGLHDAARVIGDPQLEAVGDRFGWDRARHRQVHALHADREPASLDPAKHAIRLSRQALDEGRDARRIERHRVELIRQPGKTDVLGVAAERGLQGSLCGRPGGEVQGGRDQADAALCQQLQPRRGRKVGGRDCGVVGPLLEVLPVATDIR